MASPEGISGPKPFELHHVVHLPSQGEQLQGLEASARSKLQALPSDKRIVLFTEHGGHSSFAARMATLHVLHGQTPRDAIETAEAQFTARIYRGTDEQEQEVADARARVRKAYSRGFLGSAADMVTRLTEEFPGRVLWVPEGTGLETFALIEEERAFAQRDRRLSMIPFEKRDAKTSRRRLTLVYRATTNRLREGTISDEIESLMAHPDTAAGFGFIGARHTGLPHELRERGLDVTVRNAHREEGEVAHTRPSTELINRIRTDPETTVTDAEINAAFAAESRARQIYILKHIPPVGSLSRLFSGLSNAERERKALLAYEARASNIFKKKMAKIARRSETGGSPERKARTPRLEDEVAQGLLEGTLRAQAESTSTEQTMSSDQAHPTLDDTMPDNPLDQTDVSLSERNSDRVDDRRDTQSVRRQKKQGK